MLTPEQLEEIRERRGRITAAPDEVVCVYDVMECLKDIPALLAHIEYLQGCWDAEKVGRHNLLVGMENVTRAERKSDEGRKNPH